MNRIRNWMLAAFICALSGSPTFASEASAPIVIAVLDTGVDDRHPALVDHLLPGMDVRDPTQSATDRHGHGTSVAGIALSAAAGDAVLLPIKALDDRGGGMASQLAAGIRLAVDRGAKIILISSGDPIYSEALEKAVQYAEQRGALTIAASGNDGGRVTFPGAFPTVLSVGAVDRASQVLSYSNSGPELDVVALGDQIQTTALGGGYTVQSGTSFAAPQVAGMAARLWRQSPSLTPREIRQLIKATARSLSAERWNARSGYGLVDGEQALEHLERGVLDPFTGNDTQATAALLSFDQQVAAQLASDDSADWYRVELPYDGTFEFSVDRKGLRLELFDAEQKVASGEQFIRAQARQGTVWVRVGHAGVASDATYWIETRFSIAEDAYEPNDTWEQAAPLNLDTDFVDWTGNFHREFDEDWYAIDIPFAGQGELVLTVDTTRIDPAITLEQEGAWRTKVDEGHAANMQREYWNGSLQPGQLFIGIRDYYGNAVNAQYFAQFYYQSDPSPFFKDIHSHWARNEIERLAEKKVISGYGDGTFQPDRVITKAETAALLTKILNVEVEASPDSTNDHWGSASISALVEREIIARDEASSLDMDSPITRGELSIWLSRAKFGAEPPTEEVVPFVDVSTSDAAYPHIVRLWQAGLIAGMTKTEFGPDEQATRAQLATLLHRMWFE